MKLSDLIARKPPVPWSDASKLPWNDSEFSDRMLHEHLTQEHGRASRRFNVIDRQVAWVHDAVLGGRPSRVLDLGCGPGLYTTRLAGLGHSCVGIDFSPAAVEYAQAQAEHMNLPCEYRLRDLRSGPFGTGFNAALLLFGELNTFPPKEAADRGCGGRGPCAFRRARAGGSHGTVRPTSRIAASELVFGGGRTLLEPPLCLPARL